MGAGTIDSLEVKIQADAATANTAIDNLVKKLGVLSNSLASVNGTSLTGLANGVKTLANGMKNLQGVKAADFNRIAKGIERLGNIDSTNLSTVGSALKPLADGVGLLSNTNFDNKNLQSLINSLTRLGNSNVGNLANIDFSSLGDSIKGLANSLSGADKVQQSTISMTNAIANLAKAGGNIGVVSSALPQMENVLKDFISTMSNAASVAPETITFTQAVGNLANAGTKVATTAGNLEVLSTELKKFMQVMSTAPSVNSSVIQMTQALANLAAQGSRTGSAANSLQRNIVSLSSSMGGLRGSTIKAFTSLKSFSRQLLSSMGICVGICGAIRGIKSAIDISSDLTEVQNVVDVTFGDMAYKVEDFAKVSIEQFGMSELALKQYASRFQAMGNAMGINSGLIENANSFLNKQTNDYIGLSDSMADVSLNLTKLTADMASFYNLEQDAVAEDLESIFTGQTRPLRTYGLDLTQATLQEWAFKQGLDADIQSMSQAEKTMLRYQYVLANTGAAHNDFSRTADTWANQTRILKQNFEQLASVIGGTLINAFKPLVKALNTAMGYIINFAKTISNALGKIFGWKYEESSGGTALSDDFGDAADSADDIASGVGNAADNAKKLKQQLQGFDELNVLTSDTDTGTGAGSGGGSGSGSAGGSGAGGGQWTKTDSILKEFESDIDSLYELGETISKALQNVMESIEWDKVYSKARSFGTGLAEFLNGLIDDPKLFVDIGDTIAGSINTVLNAADAFAGKFHFYNLGVDIGTAINHALGGIDWNTATSAAKNWGTGIAKTINGFFNTTNFETVGSTVAKALNTAIQFALDFGVTLDASAIGKSISDTINGFFRDFDFAGLATTLNVWVDNLEKAIGAALTGIKWSDVLSGILDFLNNIEFDTVAVIVGAILIKKIGVVKIASAVSSRIGARILSAIGLSKGIKLKELAITIGSIAVNFGISGTGAFEGIAAWIANGIDNAMTNMFPNLSAFLGNVLAGIVGGGLVGSAFPGAGTIAGAIVGGIVGALEGIKIDGKSILSMISEKFFNFDITKQFFADAKKNFEDAFSEDDFFSIGENILNGILNGFFGVIGCILEPFSNFFLWVWDELCKVFDIHSPAKNMEPIGENILLGIVAGFTATFGEITKSITDLWNNHIKPWFTKEKWSEVGAHIKEAVEEKWNEFIEWLSQTAIVKFWNENIKPWFTKEKWKENLGSIKQAFDDKWNDLEMWWKNTALVQWWNEFKNNFSSEKWKSKIGSVKTAFSSKWNEMKVWFSNTALVQFWNKVQTNFSVEKWKSKIGSIKDAMQSKWNAFKSWWNGLKLKFPTIQMPSIKWSGDFSLNPISVPHFYLEWPQYATGGFPEDGLFMANHGELVGKFSNGRTAVANNEQITQGIADAVYPAVYNAVSAAMRNNSGNTGGDINIQVNLDGNVVYKSMVKKTKERKTRADRFVLAEEIYG